MSSVKDRIRNLQQSATAAPPSKSVAELASAVERGSEQSAEQQKTLSQLQEKFDSNASSEPGSGLGARVARFDADTSQTLQDRVRRLESGAAETGSLAARASAFEREGSGVKDVAGQFAQQEATTNDAKGGLRKARAMFEAAGDEKSVQTTLSKLRMSPEHTEIADDKNPSTPSTTTSTERKPVSPRTPSREATQDGVSTRAAMFERAESEPQSNTRSPTVTQRDPPKSLSSIPPIQNSQVSEPLEAMPSEKTDARSLKEQLREVKETNEKLVSMLLEFTTAFKRLERTRDDLQKRLTELEKK